MYKRYDFEFYQIASNGDWLLYQIKNTDVRGRRDLVNWIKRDGYRYDRQQKAYLQVIDDFELDVPLRFAVVITLHK